MKIEGVKEYRVGYPTKEQTLSNPILLKKTPERWKGIAVCCGAMSIMTLAACANVESAIRQVLSGSQVSGFTSLPLYYLPEDDAVRIIADEYALNELDVELDTDYKVVANMPANVSFNRDKSQYEYTELKAKLVVDGKVKDKNLCFEYISQNDFNIISNDDEFSYVSSRISFMANYLGKIDNGTVVGDKGELVKLFTEFVAYDKNKAEQKLRQQVKEYIDQLKVSGVI